MVSPIVKEPNQCVGFFYLKIFDILKKIPYISTVITNYIHMVSKLRDEWINDPELKKWDNVSCIDKGQCNCSDDSHHIELWEHDNCNRGRIDTIVCTSCNVVIDFDIIR